MFVVFRKLEARKAPAGIDQRPSHDCYPVNPIEYKKAMLVFYETGNVSPMKRILSEQFAFSAANYF